MEFEQILKNLIKGALKSTIDTHGPITPEWIGSAEKRISGALMAELKAQPVNEIESDIEEEISPVVVVESCRHHDKELISDITDLIEARAAIMEFLGNGANEELWKPGEFYLDAFKRCIPKPKSEPFDPEYVCDRCGYIGNPPTTNTLCPECGRNAMRFLRNKATEN